MEINGHNIKVPKDFFRFSLANVLTLVFLLGLGIRWWTVHETSAAALDTNQNTILEEHGRRLDAIDKRASDAQATASKNADDLHELMTKFKIMVELVDGDH